MDVAAVLPYNVEIQEAGYPASQVNYGMAGVEMVRESIRQRQALPDAAPLACSFYDDAGFL